MPEYLTEEQHNLVMDILSAELHNRHELGEDTADLASAIDRLDELMIELGYGE